MSKIVRRSLASLALAVSVAAVPVVASAQDADGGSSSGGTAYPSPSGTGSDPGEHSSSRPPAGSADQPAADGPVFPVKGRHRYGTGAAAFGGGRGHQGQDVFAACGTPLVAAISGRVSKNVFQSAAGNYLVIDAADGTSQAYMHMLRPALPAEGERVDAGERIGQVGETGRADGCHLHFEFWTAPGWYQGGQAVDPLSRLKRWDAAARR